jgi:hypothetical protein
MPAEFESLRSLSRGHFCATPRSAAGWPRWLTAWVSRLRGGNIGRQLQVLTGEADISTAIVERMVYR